MHAAENWNMERMAIAILLRGLMFSGASLDYFRRLRWRLKLLRLDGSPYVKPDLHVRLCELREYSAFTREMHG